MAEMTENAVITDLDINGIMRYHNCKYPCLMIDYCKEIRPGKYAKAYKNFSYNEWFFPAYFENDLNVPSSVMIEAMSQTMLMTFLTLPGYGRMKKACSADFAIGIPSEIEKFTPKKREDSIWKE